jgi:hypothetical protein
VGKGDGVAVGEAVGEGDGVAVGEAVGATEGVGEGVPLRSVVVSEPLRSAEVLSSRSSSAGSVCAGGSSGLGAEATANPTPAEITVVARAHAGASTTTTITRSHPPIRSCRRSHRSTANAPRIKANAANSATSTAALMLSIILSQYPTIQGLSSSEGLSTLSGVLGAVGSVTGQPTAVGGDKGIDEVLQLPGAR